MLLSQEYSTILLLSVWNVGPYLVNMGEAAANTRVNTCIQALSEHTREHKREHRTVLYLPPPPNYETKWYHLTCPSERAPSRPTRETILSVAVSATYTSSAGKRLRTLCSIQRVQLGARRYPIDVRSPAYPVLAPRCTISLLVSPLLSPQHHEHAQAQWHRVVELRAAFMNDHQAFRLSVIARLTLAAL